MKTVANDAFVMAGAVLITYAAWLAYEPLGLFVAGALLVSGGVVGALAAKKERKP
jgi:hypothetical protein